MAGAPDVGVRRVIRGSSRKVARALLSSEHQAEPGSVDHTKRLWRTVQRAGNPHAMSGVRVKRFGKVREAVAPPVCGDENETVVLALQRAIESRHTVGSAHCESRYMEHLVGL